MGKPLSEAVLGGEDRDAPRNGLGALSLDREASRPPWILVLVWLALSALSFGLASRDLAAPGLYYDEASYAGQAKDFLRGHPQGRHMPGTETVEIGGRPFPLFVLPYLGAVKSWLIIPAFALWGSTVSTLRLSSLGWSLLALLLFMLSARRLLGDRGALIAGALLGLDPSYFFMTVHDWGPVVPGFLARFGALYFLLVWWRERRWYHLALGAAFLGLGLLHKLDFVVILGGAGLALAITRGRAILRALRQAPGSVAVACLTFVLVAAPTVWHGLAIGRGVISAGAFAAPGELVEKLHTLVATSNGSYFFRLMRVGGDFSRMYASATAPWTIFGGVALVASVALVVIGLKDLHHPSSRSLAAFLVLACGLETAALLLLPGAVRAHHALLIDPLPHLIVAAVLVRLLRSSAPPRLVRAVVTGLVLVLLANDLFVITKTQGLIDATGGRGLWSNALARFADEVRDRPDLTVVSLDWGFNEQLLFLTAGPRLVEPFWDPATGGRIQIDASPNVLYLVHSPDYTVLHQGERFLRFCQSLSAEQVSLRAYRDRQGQIAFYAIRFLPRGRQKSRPMERGQPSG